MERNFTIAHVAALHKLQIISVSGADTYAVCPFCGAEKKKFAFTIQKGNKKNMYNCFKCGEKGDAISLHIKLMIASNPGLKEYYEGPMGIKRACAEIYHAIDNNTEFDTFNAALEERIKNTHEAERRSDEQCSAVYFELLKRLTLKPEHKADLLRRGLTEEDIKRYRFKTAPENGRGIARDLIKSGFDLKGIPGFYTDKYGKWNFNVAMKGYLCPVFDGEKNLIIGFQIRVDNPVDGTKYLWVSSQGKENGASCGALSTMLPGKNPEVVIITEGILKATVIYSLLKCSVTVIGIPGVKCLKSLDTYLERFSNSVVWEAYDMDKLIKTEDEHLKKKTEGIFNSAVSLKKKIEESYLPVHSLTWDADKEGYWKERYKGLDDFLLEYADKELFISGLTNKAHSELSFRSFLE